jgi:hypothetical protein
LLTESGWQPSARVASFEYIDCSFWVAIDKHLEVYKSTIETSDLIGLMLVLRESMDMQIQFWISVTFAVVVASVSASKRLSFRLRMLSALLYLVATAAFISRWYHDYNEMQAFLNLINSRGLEFEALQIPAALRMALIGIGTFSTVIFLFKDYIKATDDDSL